MENNNFEKEIKDMLNQNQPGLDHDDIWDNIEPKLKKKKKRRFLFFWFFGAGLAALSYFAFQEMNQPLPSTATAMQTKASTSAINATDDSSKLERADSESSDLNSKILSDNENRTAATSSNLPATTSTNTSDYNNKNTKNRKSILQQPSAAIPFGNTTSPSKENDSAIVKKTNELEPISKENDINNFDNSITTDEVSTEQATIEDVITTEETDKRKTEAKLSKSSKNIKDKKRRKWEWNWEKKKKKKRKRKKRTRPVRKSPWEIQMQTAIAPAIAFKNLKENKSTTESFALLEKEKEANRQLEAFSFNLGLHFQHKSSGLLIASALEYRQINERFYYLLEEEKTVLEPGIVAITENLNGDIIDSETGLKSKDVTTTTEKRFYNHHRFISLPIGIGKAWVNRKSGYKFLTGLDLNLMYRFKGAIYNQQLNPVKMARSENRGSYNKVFKSSAGIGLWVSGEYSRAINPRLSWLVAPKFQIPLSSSMNSEYALSQKHLLLQFDVGLNYLLNPKKKKKRKKEKRSKK